jgi:hypothetical protein
MVGGDAEPDETPGRRQPVDEVDLDAWLLAREKLARRVEPRRAGADDRDPEWRSLAHAGTPKPTRMGRAITPRI